MRAVESNKKISFSKKSRSIESCFSQFSLQLTKNKIRPIRIQTLEVLPLHPSNNLNPKNELILVCLLCSITNHNDSDRVSYSNVRLPPTEWKVAYLKFYPPHVSHTTRFSSDPIWHRCPRATWHCGLGS